MNNPNAKALADRLRNWFLTENILHPEHILANMDTMAIMIKFRFGNRLINEASAEADQLRMIGATQEALLVEQDIFVARVNLNKVHKAYQLAMN